MIRAIDKWLIPWIGSRLRKRTPFKGVRHLVFCIADHFEPFRKAKDETGNLRPEGSQESGGGGHGDCLTPVPPGTRVPEFAEGMKSYNYETHPAVAPRELWRVNSTREIGSGSGKIFGGQPNLPPQLSGRDGDALGDVRRWTDIYRRRMAEFRDADGRGPRHTFFYPAEDYDAGCIEHMAGFCREGACEVEVQLHHRNDTPDGFCEKIELFKNQLQKHGLLGMDADGRHRFGFVHGNWALCNSRPDGDWCGVNEELGLLSKLGCYADFTFPSAPSPTQPRMVNCIYRAVDREGSPRGCERGRRIADCRLQTTDCRLGEEEQGEVGGQGDEDCRQNTQIPKYPSTQGPKWEEKIPKYPNTQGPKWEEDGQIDHRHQTHPSRLAAAMEGTAIDHRPGDGELMLITGPMGVRWDGLRPRLENSALTSANMPGAARVKFWVDTGISVAGRPDWVFVKVHMHGFNELDGRLLTEGLPEMHRYLQEHYNDGTNWRLHYATAREMYNAVRALESGECEDMAGWRDFEIAGPING